MIESECNLKISFAKMVIFCKNLQGGTHWRVNIVHVLMFAQQKLFHILFRSYSSVRWCFMA